MKIIALIPSLNRFNILNKTISELISLNQVDDIIVLSEIISQSVSKARKQLLKIAYEKYGDGVLFLMLNDDCVLNEKSNIKWAAEYFNNNKKIGILQFPVSAEQEDIFISKPVCFHTFLIKSDLVGKGLNYTDNEHLDEILFSLDVYFAGYENGMTLRCIIPHHVALNKDNALGGGIFESVEKKEIIPQSFITQKYNDLIKWNKGHYMFPELPNIFSVLPNKRGYELHCKNNKLI